MGIGKGMHIIAKRQGPDRQWYQVWDDGMRRLLRIGSHQTGESVSGKVGAHEYWRHMAMSVPLSSKTVLILGYGGGTIARVLREIGSNAVITGVDNDPIVLELADLYFDANLYADIIVNDDAESFCDSHIRGFLPPYDAVLIDLFRSGGIQVPCDKAKLLVAPGGVLITNHWSPGHGNEVTIERP